MKKLQDLASLVATEFQKIYGRPPRWIAAAPGRVNVIGEQGGVYGCRMTGGGFGGCCVALVKTSKLEDISKKIAADYKARTGIAATIFASRPAAGATVLKG